MNTKVDAFLNRAKKWQPEMEKLRKILLGCDLTEDLKWGKPCYAHDGRNVIVVQPFKAFCALLFFKGVLLKDPDGILVKTGANTHVGRQIRLTDVREIEKMEPVLKKYIRAAIEIEESGAPVPTLKNSELKLPDELQSKLRSDPAFKAAFHALTPGRQRGYIFHFSGAKQSATRSSRIEKCTPKILKGRGLMD